MMDSTRIEHEAATNQPRDLWCVRPDPELVGVYRGTALLRSGKVIDLLSESAEHLRGELIRLQLANQDDGPDNFLAAWKRGVELAGARLFHCTAPSVAEATDKDQLRPRWDDVEVFICSACSPGERLFLMELCSFYNSEWMAEAKKKLRLPRMTYGAASGSLDADRRQVLADLLVSYRGW